MDHVSQNKHNREFTAQNKEGPATGDIWITQEDQAKQGNARKFDSRNAEAAPDHPHIGGETGGRQGK